MTNEERKVFELALEALEKTQNEGFNLPGSAIREAITAIKEALAQPKKLDQDEVDIRSRLYQRIHELETQLAQLEDKKCENCGEFGECCQDAQPERKPLTDEMRKQMKERCDSMEMRGAFADGWMSSEAAHGIKENT